MNIQQLIYTIKVLECGSITKAAQELNISQPTITKAISSLEKEYSVKIFERHNKGVITTEEGKKFLRYAKGVVHNIGSLDTIFKKHKSESSQKLFIATLNLGFISEVFVQICNEYSEDNLEFELYMSNRDDIINSLKNGSCNMGIVVRTCKESKDVEWNLEKDNLEERVIDVSDVYVHMGKRSSLYDNDLIEFNDTKCLPNIALDISKQDVYKWKLNDKDVHVNLKKIVYCNSIEQCIDILNNTKFIMLGNKWLKSYFKNTSIRSSKISNNRNVCELICITRKGERLSDIELEFIERVKKAVTIIK